MPSYCKLIESFVDDALIRELKEMIQKLSVEVKNNRADIELLLNQPGKLNICMTLRKSFSKMNF